MQSVGTRRGSLHALRFATLAAVLHLVQLSSAVTGARGEAVHRHGGGSKALAVPHGHDITRSLRLLDDKSRGSVLVEDLVAPGYTGLDPLLAEKSMWLPGAPLSYLTRTVALALALVYIILVFSVAVWYRVTMLRSLSSAAPRVQSKETEVLTQESGPKVAEGDFSDRLVLDWSSNKIICAWSIAFPCVRWADTMHQLNFMYFFGAVSVWATFLVLNGVLFGLGYIALALLGGISRGLIRKKLKYKPAFFQDVCAWLCCMPCALAQEARHVERFALVGTPCGVGRTSGAQR